MKKALTLIMMLIALQSGLLASNSWTSKASMSVAELQGAKSFSIGNKGYVVTGMDGSGTGSVKLWEYDQATDSWSSKSNFPGVTRTDAVAFSIGTKGYVGTGSSVSGPSGLNDFWEWDQATNVWSQKSNFPGTARKYAAGFAMNGKGYIGTGWDVSMSLKSDFWEYNPSTNAWTSIASLPTTPRYGGTGFSIGNKGYYCSGHDGFGGSTFPNDLYEYDPVTNTWTSKASLPSSGGLNGAGRDYAFSFTLGLSGFLGTGTYIDPNISFMPLYCDDFWEYHQPSNTWTQLTSFPGGNRQWSIGFGIGNKGYAGTGEAGLNYYNDLWEWSSTTTTGINENLKDEPAVVVNSSSQEGHATIKVRKSGNYIISNSLGQTILSLQLKKEEVYNLSLSDYTNGVYFINSVSSPAAGARFIVSK